MIPWFYDLEKKIKDMKRVEMILNVIQCWKVLLFFLFSWFCFIKLETNNESITVALVSLKGGGRVTLLRSGSSYWTPIW